MATSKTARHAIEYRLIESLAPDPENAREHSRAQVKQIARSIEAFGFNVPILVDAELKVVAGHGRLEALKLLGHVEAPVVLLEHLTPAQAKAFAIADNRATDTSSFNDRQLALNLKALAEIDLDFDIEATGFSIGEIDLKIEGLADLEPDRSDPDDQLPPSGPPVCGPGDLWILGEHRILCADATDPASYAELLGTERAGGAVIDVPYGASVSSYVKGGKRRKHREFIACSGELKGSELTAFFSKASALVSEYCADGAVAFFFIDWRHVHPLLTATSAAFDELINICVWAKTNGGMGSLYRSAHELVLVLKKGRAKHRNNVQLGRFGRNRTNLWSYAGANSFMRSADDADLLAQHPTPKPVQMVADALLDVTARRDLVLDSFLGSGSTLLACERIGRRCRGIELDPLYVDLAIRRWQRLTGEDAVLEATGETFDSLCAKAEAA